MPKRKRVGASTATRRPFKAPRKTYTSTAAVSTGRITKRYIQGGTKTKKILRYYATFTLNPPAGGQADTKIFRANGLYDPEVAIGGHQPRGFDQYMAMYDHYTVTKATAKVYFDNNAEQSGLLGVIHVRDGAVPLTAPIDVMEYGMKSVTTLMAANSGSGGSVMKSTTLAVDIAKFLGVKDILDAKELSGTATSDPSEEVNFHISAFPTNVGDAASINCAVELEYEVWFHEPKNPTSS